MNLKKRSNSWVDHKLITKEQQQLILKHEDKRFLPFVLFSFLWLGLGCILIGLFSAIFECWNQLPIFIRVIGFLCLSVGVIAGGVYAFKLRKKMLFETVLFVAFLLIGAGVGIFAQVFNFSLSNVHGLLGWALFSFLLVFFSKREFLFLLWIPLFLGGILGSLKLELLLLFFEQSPLFSTILLMGILFVLILTTKNLKTHFFQAVYKWCVCLYFTSLFLMTREFSSVFESLIVFLFFLLLLLALSIKEKRVYLFHVTNFCLFLRLGYLYFELFENKRLTSLYFLTIGGLILGVGFLWFFFEKKISSKTPPFLK